MASTLVLYLTALMVTIWQTTDSLGIRRDIAELTKEERSYLLETLYIMKNSPSKWNSSWSAYDYYTRVHQVAFGRDQWGHNRWSFLPWHRAYLQLFEAEIREYYVGPNPEEFYLPYWNPTDPTSTYAALHDTDFLGGDGDPLGGWDNNDEMTLSCTKWPIDVRLPGVRRSYNHSCLSRGIGQGWIITTSDGINITYGTALPSTSDWYSAIYDEKLPYDVYPYYIFNLTWKEYNNSFRARIEGTNPEFIIGDMNHGLLHNYIGGHVGEDTGPNDPAFFLLHGWIDLMWALYQDQWGDWAYYTFPQQYLDFVYFQAGNSFKWFNNSQYNSRDVMDHRHSLGYVYDVQIDRESDNDDAKWYDGWNESPWYQIWIVLSVFVIGLIGGCCFMKFCCYQKKSRNTHIYQELDALIKP